jgi:integrase
MPESVPRTKGSKTYQTSDGRYYATGTKPRVYFGADFDLALLRFRAWQSRQVGAQIPLGRRRIKNLDDDAEVRAALQPDAELDVDPDGGVTVSHLIDEETFWGKMTEFLSTPGGRRLAAQRTGVRELEWLLDVEKPAAPMALTDIGERYVNKRPAIGKDEKKQSRKFWKQFIGIVGVKTIDELKQEHIERYRDTIFAIQEAGKFVDGHVTKRFTKIKTMFSWIDRMNITPTQTKRVLALLTVMESPGNATLEVSKPISRADFHKLLAAADTEEKAILLLGLNCAFYPVDIRLLKKNKGLNLEGGFYSDYRNKTKKMRVPIPQISVLWKRTIQAVRKHLKENPNQTDYIFATQSGGPYADQTFRLKFQDLRDKASVDKSVIFPHLRDGAATYAKVDEKQTNMLLGHSSGLSDRYVLRHTQDVSEACRNIERHYFG